MGYETAALDGYGYETAALDGYGYETAALDGYGKRSSADQKAHMAWVRSFKGKGVAGAGKRCLKGRGIGTVLSLGLAGAKGLYKLIKFIKKKKAEKAAAKEAAASEGGRALILDKAKREAYINDLMERASGRRRSALWPYTPAMALKHYNQRKSRLSPKVRAYLGTHGIEDALFDTATMRRAVKEANAAMGRSRTRKSASNSKPKSKKRQMIQFTEEDDPDFAPKKKSKKRKMIQFTEEDDPDFAPPPLHSGVTWD